MAIGVATNPIIYHLLLLFLISTLQKENSFSTSQSTMPTTTSDNEKELLNDIVRCDHAHMISTVRVKEKFGLEFDETKGKNRVVSLGEQQIQQDGLKYEPDLVLHMISPGNMDGTNPVVEVIKSRYAIFRTGEEYEITAELLHQLRAYLEEGIDPEEIFKAQKEEVINQINKTKKLIKIYKNIILRNVYVK